MNSSPKRNQIKINRTARLLFWGLVLLFFWQIVTSYSQLPDTIASHFGADGRPNGWMSKQSFFVLEVLGTGLIAGLFYFLAYFLNKIPKSLINLPNKDYWLAPERRKETFQILANYLIWLGNATLLFLFLMLQQILDFNEKIENVQRSVNGWLPTVLYLIFTAVWVGSLIWRFRKPAD